MLIPTIFFAASFLQATTGFGLALVAMPLLVGLLGIRTATPLVALVGITNELVMLARYRRSLNVGNVARLSIASLTAVPLGVLLLVRVEPGVFTWVLGVVLIGYSLYGLFGPSLPHLHHHGWAYGFGFVAGLLSGAFNTSGPPVVIYGSCRRWDPQEFKGNLQGFFFLNGLMTVSAHTLSGNLTETVWTSYVWALPGLALGLLAGFQLDPFLSPRVFRRVVFLILLALGLRLIVSGLWC